MVGAVAPPQARRAAERSVAIGSARDRAAADAIAQAASEGHPAAIAFAGEADDLLVLAGVHRARASRLRTAAAKAAKFGSLGLSQMGADAAEEEDAEADRLEGEVVRAVRESHDHSLFGYLSPEEARLLESDRVLSSMTVTQREDAFASMLGQLMEQAYNFGSDEDEGVEVDLEAADKLGLAADVFGGDLPVVMGEDAFAGFWDKFKASCKTLRKRLARTKKRLRQVEGKLEALEDAGKSGLRVMVLQKRIPMIEKRIGKLQEKLQSCKKSARKVKRAERKAEKVERAEAEVISESTAAAAPEVQDLDADLEALELEASDLDDDGADMDIMAAIEVFGAHPKRVARARARAARLQRAEAAGRRPRPARPRRRPVPPRRRQPAWMTRGPDGPPPNYNWRARRLLHFLQHMVAVPHPHPHGAAPAHAMHLQGSAARGPERRPFIGFFDRRAASYGGDSVGMDDDEAFGGFWDSFKSWWGNLFQKTGQKIQRESAASRAARAAREPYHTQVREASQQVMANRALRSQARKDAAEPHATPIALQKETVKVQRKALRSQRRATNQAEAELRRLRKGRRQEVKAAHQASTPEVQASRRQRRKTKAERRRAGKQAAASVRHSDASATVAGAFGLSDAALEPEDMDLLSGAEEGQLVDRISANLRRAVEIYGELHPVVMELREELELAEVDGLDGEDDLDDGELPEDDDDLLMGVL